MHKEIKSIDVITVCFMVIEFLAWSLLTGTVKVTKFTSQLTSKLSPPAKFEQSQPVLFI